MYSAGRFIFIYKIVSVIIFLGSLLLLPVISFAQEGGPDCGGIDPIGTSCPLDTWVIALAFFAVIFAAIYLHRKQKSLQPVAKGIK
ncbi:hypothetical protein [Mucilaginibacter sp. OK098]|jgi:hypothetical protein|uniref:hypothetical protein n=1 Tax=Mucilaginibacter sp. OK098 TaxID=1855297 RepID=UPI00091E250E|nr:hypothetical protein [Mucilaginibacter sp. OK098]SHN37259.1 hypothetical protein SAMN05216524_11515 [Mucilaginibacter sp. OK098]